MKKTIGFILAAAMIFSLSACGTAKKEDIVQTGQPVASASPSGQELLPIVQSDVPMEDGWLMKPVEMPLRPLILAGTASDGDWLWISSCCQINGRYALVLLGLDTLSSQWRQFDLGLAELGLGDEYDLSTVSAYRLSVKDGRAWMSVECSSFDRGFTAQRLVTVDTSTGEISSVAWSPDELYLSPDRYTNVFAALGADRALLISDHEACVIDSKAEVLSRSSIQAETINGAVWLGSQLYLKSYEGIILFDAQTLSLGTAINFSQVADSFVVAGSQPGDILYSANDKLYSIDSSGHTSLVFD